ncbi:MAG: LuxR C-terminal-related transcriptional regulator [Pseudonocardia sp.]
MSGTGQVASLVTVVLVDDPDLPTVGRSAAEALAAHGLDLLARATAPCEAARVVSEVRPGVVVVDLDGVRTGAAALSAIDSITTRVPETPVLAISSCDGHAAVLAAVRAGAAGYLVKTANVVGFADAVRRVAAGEAVFSSGLADLVLEEHGRLTGPAEARPMRLTDRESDVLRLVVDGLTARQIATRLVLSQRTVENHVQRVLRKLRVPNRAALVRHAIECGLA